MTLKAAHVWGCALVLALCSVSNAAEWVQTWGAAPLPPTPALGPFPATPAFNNQTIRQTVRVSLGGQRLRIRFTNEYGAKPLAIGAAFVALADERETSNLELRGAFFSPGNPAPQYRPGRRF